MHCEFESMTEKSSLNINPCLLLWPRYALSMNFSQSRKEWFDLIDPALVYLGSWIMKIKKYLRTGISKTRWTKKIARERERERALNAKIKSHYNIAPLHFPHLRQCSLDTGKLFFLFGILNSLAENLHATVFSRLSRRHTLHPWIFSTVFFSVKPQFKINI